MSPYLVALVIHVVTAVLGLGLVTAVVLVAGTTAVPSDARIGLIRKLARGGSLTMAVMVLSGIAIVGAAHGTGADAGWFRASMVLMVLAGACLGLVQRSLRRAGAAPEQAITSAGRFGAIACACLGVIVVLMQAKPF